MDIKTVETCPLGHKCKEIKDGKIHQCAWHIRMLGINPQTGEDQDEWGCAIAWTPILLVENARTNRGQTAALESFRNDVVQGNAQMTNALIAAAHAKQQLIAQQRYE